jgi:hypothetical protein
VHKKTVQRLDSFSKQSLSQARTVLAQARLLAERVRDGFPLNQAYEIAMSAKNAPETDDSLRARLANLAPDLAAIVQDGNLNPPYGGNARLFVERVIREYQVGNVSAACVLVNSHPTETKWFQELFDYTVCFVAGRIDFGGPLSRMQQFGVLGGTRCRTFPCPRSARRSRVYRKLNGQVFAYNQPADRGEHGGMRTSPVQRHRRHDPRLRRAELDKSKLIASRDGVGRVDRVQLQPEAVYVGVDGS